MFEGPAAALGASGWAFLVNGGNKFRARAISITPCCNRALSRSRMLNKNRAYLVLQCHRRQVLVTTPRFSLDLGQPSRINLHDRLVEFSLL